MTSTNDGKDVKSTQTSGLRGKTYYIELYKSLDAQLNSEGSLGERVAHLCAAWRRVHTLCLHSAPSTHPHLLTWIQRHTAKTVLQSEWQSPTSKDEQIKLDEAIDAFTQECHAAATVRDGVVLPWEVQLLARAAWFKGILASPWDHPVLKALLDSRGERPSTDDILEWLREERSAVFTARLRQLALSKCTDLALALLSAVMDLVRATRHTVSDLDLLDETKDSSRTKDVPSTFESILNAEAGFSDVWDLLTDMELVLLHKCDRSTRVIDLAKQMPLSSGYQVVERLLNRLDAAPKEKKLWKNAKDVATLITQVMIARCMVVPACAGAVRSALYWCARALVRAVPLGRLPRATATLAAPAASARHLHTLAAAVHAQQSAESGELKPFVVELYVRAITFGMNELEKLKLKPEYEEKEARATEQTLASWFIQLGQLLAGSARVRCECVLTAFSVHPAPAMFDRIRAAPALPAADTQPKQEPESKSEFGSWASDSRSQTNFVKTSEHLNMKHIQNQGNVLSTAILSEGERLGLDAELCQDITVLLSGPRVKTLSWDMDRTVLLQRCRAYMERTGSGTRAVTTELKYLNLDPRHYQHLPEENDDEDDLYYGIEKGYEHLVEVEPQPEEIWEDAFYDLERTDSADESCEEKGSLVRHKKKTKHLSHSESDSDPLSLVAEKREKKKERPHSKERSKERKKKPKADKNNEVKDKDKEHAERRKDEPKDKKKEKKERKKREKKEKQAKGPLGVKIIPAFSEHQSNYNINITDSDGYSSGQVKHEGIDESVIYDGHFSMDELKSPERKPEDANKGLSSSVLQNAQNQYTKKMQVNRPITELPKMPAEHSPTFSNASSPSGNYIPNMGRSNQIDKKEEVKKGITKLLQFRRQKSLESFNNPGTSHRQAEKSPQAQQSQSHSVTGTKSMTISNIYFNKKQKDLLNSIKGETKSFKAIFYPNDQKDTASTCSRVQPFSPTYSRKTPRSSSQTDLSHTQFNQALKSMQQAPVLLNDSPNRSSQTLGFKSQTQPIQKMSEPSVSHISSYQKFLQELETNANAGLGMHKSPASTEKKKQIRPISKVTPVNPIAVKPEIHNSSIVIKPEATVNPTTQEMVNTEASVSSVMDNIIKTDPRMTPAMHNTVKSDRKVNPAVHNVLKTDPIVTPAMHNTVKTEPRVTTTMHNVVKTNPKISPQCAKSVVQAKKVENVPNTFSRLSYMHKNKLIDKSKQQTETCITLQSSVSEELDRRIAELKSRKAKAMLSKYEQCMSRVGFTLELKPKETPRVEVQMIQNPPAQSSLNKKHPFLSNILKNTGLTIKSTNDQQKYVKTEKPNCSKSEYTALTEKDQQDLLRLLGQQNMLNKQQPQFKAKVSPLKICNYSPSVNNTSNSSLDSMKSETSVSASPLITSKTLSFQQQVVKIDDTGTTQVQCDNTNYRLPANTTIKKTTATKQNSKLRNPTKKRTLKQVNIEPNKTVFELNKALVRKYIPKPPVLTPKYEEDQKEQDWTKVLDEIRSHKTPSRGPNALDIVLNKNSFEKLNEKNQLINSPLLINKDNNLTKQTPPIVPKSKVTSTIQQALNAKPSTKSISKVESSSNKPIMKKAIVDSPKTLNDVGKKSPSNPLKIYPEVIKQTHQRQFNQEEDPFISGIPNSDYEILEELMDDDLRQEIGELSDEESYRTPPAIVMPPKDKNTAFKNETVIKKVAVKQYSSSVESWTKSSEVTTASATSVPQSTKPKLQILSNEKVDIRKISKNLIGSKKVQQESTTMASKLQDVIYNIKTTLPMTNVTTTTSAVLYNAPVDICPPAINNMVIIDPFGMRSVNQTYVTVTNSPNIVYQQFTAPVESQIIIGNTFISTVPTSAARVNVIYNNNNYPVTPAELPIMHIPESTTASTIPIQTTIAVPNLSPAKPFAAEILNKSNDGNTEILNAPELKTGFQFSNVSLNTHQCTTELTLNNNNKVEVCSTKASERKVLSEVQENLTKPKLDTKVPETIETIKTKNQMLSNDFEKKQEVSKDEDRLAKKRLSIINRTIIHRDFHPVIPLTYAPLTVAAGKRENETVSLTTQSVTKLMNDTNSNSVSIIVANTKESNLESLKVINNSKEKGITEPYRRILLRSSNKVEAEVVLPESNQKLVHSKTKLKPTALKSQKVKNDTDQFTDASCDSTALHSKQLQEDSSLQNVKAKNAKPNVKAPISTRASKRIHKKANEPKEERVNTKKVIVKADSEEIKKQLKSSKSNKQICPSEEPNNKDAKRTCTDVTKANLDTKAAKVEAPEPKVEAPSETVCHSTQTDDPNWKKNLKQKNNVLTKPEINGKFIARSEVKNDVIEILSSPEICHSNLLDEHKLKHLNENMTYNNINNTEESNIHAQKINSLIGNKPEKLKNEEKTDLNTSELTEGAEDKTVISSENKGVMDCDERKHNTVYVENIHSPVSNKLLVNEKLSQIVDDIESAICAITVSTIGSPLQETSDEVNMTTQKTDETEKIPQTTFVTSDCAPKYAKSSVVHNIKSPDIIPVKEQIGEQDAVLHNIHDTTHDDSIVSEDKNIVVGKEEQKSLRIIMADDKPKLKKQKIGRKVPTRDKCLLNTKDSVELTQSVENSALDNPIDKTQTCIGSDRKSKYLKEKGNPLPEKDKTTLLDVTTDQNLNDKNVLKAVESAKLIPSYENDQHDKIYKAVTTKAIKLDDKTDEQKFVKEMSKQVKVPEDLMEKQICNIDNRNTKSKSLACSKSSEKQKNAVPIDKSVSNELQAKAKNKEANSLNNKHIPNNLNTLNERPFPESASTNPGKDDIVLSSESDLDPDQSNIMNTGSLEGNDVNKSKQACNDIPQSYKDSIQIEEVLLPGNVNPFKRCVRIKLPNNKIFKATVVGKVNVSFDTLFEEPALKNILLSSFSNRKRYTLNIQQLSTTDHKIVTTQVHDISVRKAHIPLGKTETVNLISDDEEEICQRITTACGIFKVKNVDPVTLAKHQQKLSVKCLVKLPRCDDKPKIDPLVQAQLQDLTVSPDLPTEVIEIEDSSSDDETSQSGIEVLTKRLLKELGVNSIIKDPEGQQDQIGITSERPSRNRKSKYHRERDPRSVNTESEISSFSQTVTSNNPSVIQENQQLNKDNSKIITRDCYIRLINCDNLVKEIRKNTDFFQDSISIEDEIVLSDSDDDGSFSILNESVELGEPHAHIERETSPLMRVFEAIHALQDDNTSGKTSPVMEVYDTIVALQEKPQVIEPVECFASEISFLCVSDWFKTKCSLRLDDKLNKTRTIDDIFQEIVINRTDMSTDCETDAATDLSIADSEIILAETFTVPSLISILSKYFEDNPIIYQMQNIAKIDNFPKAPLKRKLRSPVESTSYKITKPSIRQVNDNKYESMKSEVVIESADIDLKDYNISTMIKADKNTSSVTELEGSIDKTSNNANKQIPGENTFEHNMSDDTKVDATLQIKCNSEIIHDFNKIFETEIRVNSAACKEKSDMVTITMDKIAMLSCVVEDSNYCVDAVSTVNVLKEVSFASTINTSKAIEDVSSCTPEGINVSYVFAASNEYEVPDDDSTVLEFQDSKMQKAKTSKSQSQNSAIVSEMPSINNNEEIKKSDKMQQHLTMDDEKAISKSVCIEKSITMESNEVNAVNEENFALNDDVAELETSFLSCQVTIPTHSKLDSVASIPKEVFNINRDEILINNFVKCFDKTMASPNVNNKDFVSLTNVESNKGAVVASHDSITIPKQISSNSSAVVDNGIILKNEFQTINIMLQSTCIDATAVETNNAESMLTHNENTTAVFREDFVVADGNEISEIENEAKCSTTEATTDIFVNRDELVDDLNNVPNEITKCEKSIRQTDGSEEIKRECITELVRCNNLEKSIRENSQEHNTAKKSFIQVEDTTCTANHIQSTIDVEVLKLKPDDAAISIASTALIDGGSSEIKNIYSESTSTKECPFRMPTQRNFDINDTLSTSNESQNDTTTESKECTEIQDMPMTVFGNNSISALPTKIENYLLSDTSNKVSLAKSQNFETVPEKAKINNVVFESKCTLSNIQNELINSMNKHNQNEPLFNTEKLVNETKESSFITNNDIIIISPHDGDSDAVLTQEIGNTLIKQSLDIQLGENLAKENDVTLHTVEGRIMFTKGSKNIEDGDTFTSESNKPENSDSDLAKENDETLHTVEGRIMFTKDSKNNIEDEETLTSESNKPDNSDSDLAKENSETSHRVEGGTILTKYIYNSIKDEENLAAESNKHENLKSGLTENGYRIELKLPITDGEVKVSDIALTDISDTMEITKSNVYTETHSEIANVPIESTSSFIGQLDSLSNKTVSSENHIDLTAHETIVSGHSCVVDKLSNGEVSLSSVMPAENTENDSAISVELNRGTKNLVDNTILQTDQKINIKCSTASLCESLCAESMGQKINEISSPVSHYLNVESKLFMRSVNMDDHYVYETEIVVEELENANDELGDIKSPHEKDQPQNLTLNLIENDGINSTKECEGNKDIVNINIKEVDCVKNLFEKDSTLVYRDDSGVILKGIEYEDPEIGTCYVFPLEKSSDGSTSEVLNNSVGSAIEVIQELEITTESEYTHITDLYDEIDLEVIQPSKNYSKRNLKRKSDMRDVSCSEKRSKRNSRTRESKEIRVTERKYRKGKNIDFPKLTAASISQSGYIKDFKRRLDYYSTVGFSYAITYSTEFIDALELLKEWPITEPTTNETQDEDEDKNVHALFAEISNDENPIRDPLRMTLVEEINADYNEKDYSIWNTEEINFNMGFGEGSGRVIQNLDGGTISKFSAATLSDVKQTQPFLLSEKNEKSDQNISISSKEEQLQTIKRYLSFIKLREKVQTFFENTSFQLTHELDKKKIGDSDDYDASSFPFELFNSKYIQPCPIETVIQVVQIGQLPVSAAAQNPVTCDPRVTQVSNASPSQCSVENNLHDDSQPEIKTEYTELTTADLSLPLADDYAHHNQVPHDSHDTPNIAMSTENIPIETELIKSEVKIELVEETPEEKENNDLSEGNNHINNVDYLYNTNNINASIDSEFQALFDVNKEEPYEDDVQQKPFNGSQEEKTDQIAHAMNAAGITTSETANIRAQALVNILTQKIRQGAITTTPNSTNNYSKVTSINAMSLQQALASILPPPLNQTSSTENNQQNQNTVTPQVLHIVQGKNASGNQITFDNTQQSVITTPNATPVLHIVQNKAATTGQNSNGTPAPLTNTFSGLSIVDAGLQQGGNQLLHIVNTGSQKNNNAGQLLKRVNLLTNLTNVQGSNEQKMVQFVCKSADGKAIQLNAPHQRSMVLRLQPIESPAVQPATPKLADTNHEMSPNQNTVTSGTNKDHNNTQQEIKSRSVYEENYAKFIQNSSNKPTLLEKSNSLPKFNQAFGKAVFQDGNQKQNEHSNSLPPVSNNDSSECQSTDNSINLDHIRQIGSPPLLIRKPPTPTTQAQQNLVQQIKQTIAPMNIQTMHGGVIYTRQIPVNIGGGQTINLITVPSTELVDEPGQKQQINQGETIEPSIIKIVPHSQASTNVEVSDDNDNAQQNAPQPQQMLTQMRIKLPMLSKAPQMVSGARVVRPSFFQIQRNVIGGGNQAVYQQLVLTAAPPLGQQTIRLPQAQTRQIKVPENQSSNESQMSSSTLEQLREFDMVLEQVKERSTVQPNSNSSNSSFKLHSLSTDTTDSPATASSTAAETTQVLYSIGSSQPLNVTYVNRKSTITTPTTSTFVRSPDSSGIADSPTSSSHSQIPHTSTSEASSSETTTHHKSVKVSSKSKSRPKSSHSSNSMKLNTVPPKTSTQKPLEDEQTTQRILYILAEYKEQVENSPDKDKPAPRRRSNPPTNPGSSRRKKSGSRRSGRDLSPIGDDTCRTMGSEDSSCGTSQGDCTESCMDPHSPQDSPRKVVRKLAFEQDPPTTTQPRPQPQRNVIVADGQTITVARGTAGKPATAVLMPTNYILPVSMVKGGQQIAIVTNRGPKLLTVGGGEGGTTNALLLQRLIGPASLKPMLTRPGVRHVRLPTAALQNLQAFNFTTATTIQPPDSTASPAAETTTSDLTDTNRDHSPWTDRETDIKPDRASSPDESEPWHLPSSADPHDYMYEETVRADNMDRTVLDPIQDRYSPDMEAQRIFDKMFDVDTKKSYSHVDSPRCAYDIDASDCDDKPYQVVHKRDHRQTRLSHVSAAALRHKYAILEHELRLQKSLSEECEDLGVDSPSASELFPEAELLFAASPAQDHGHDTSQHAHTPQPTLLNQSVIQPDIDDQIATDQLLPRHHVSDDRQDLDVNLGLGDVGIVTVSEDGMQATIALDHEEFARAHPNTTFHSEPTDEGVVQPFTITGIKSRHITSTIFHSNRAPATVLMTAPQATVISQATAETSRQPVKYSDIDNMMHAIPTAHNNNINLSSVLVKDDGLTRFDNILTDTRELHLSHTASAIVHSAGNATQVIRRVCYDDTKRERDSSFLMDEPEAIIAGDDAKMVAEDSSRDATLGSMGGDVDDGNSSPERHAELFWESNSASERSESRRPLDFSSDSEKCCKSPSYDETNSTDSSGVGTHMRLDSVIKEARGVDRSGSADGSSADDTHPPLRTYPPKRLYHTIEGEMERSLTGKTRAGERSPDMEVRRRASGRGVVKRGCHCCNGSPAPPRPKKPRQRKPTMDFTN